MTRNFLKRNNTIIVLTLVIAFCLYASLRAAGVFEPKEWKSYEVQSGDTLWGIAQQHNVYKDVRDTVALISGENHVDPLDLRPGMLIQVPVQ